MKPGCSVLLGTLCAVLAFDCAASDRFGFLPDKGDANLTFYLDNDLFANTDQNYTNGIRLSWISGSRDPNEFGRVQRFLKRLNGDSESRALFRKLSGFSGHETLEYNYGFSLTQLMFTPEDLQAPVAPPGQRPYAGWLGVDLSLQTKDDRALNALSLAIGTTGPHSYAQEAQDFVHDIRGLEEFQGWDSQIPNEATLNLYSTQRRRLTLNDPGWGAFGIDGFTEWRLAVGTFLTGANVGTLIRFGWNLPLDFADARLSVTAYSHQPFTSSRTQRSSWSLYGVVGALGSVVAHDITLDGPVFRNFDTGTSSETLVGELYAGFGIRYRRWNFSYVHTYRSREFKGQDDAPSFGSLTLSYSL
jgi:hypothetical protein